MVSSVSTSLPCVDHADVFLHPLLEEGKTAGRASERRQQQRLQQHAAAMCASCPMLEQCRFEAVVKFDVAGFVAGTTPAERRELRQLLDVRVPAEDLDSLSGAFTPNRQIKHEDVVRLRNANPHDTLERLAERLRCSLSTVKRHLRKARQQGAQLSAAPAAEPTVAHVSLAAESLRMERSRERAA